VIASCSVRFSVRRDSVAVVVGWNKPVAVAVSVACEVFCDWVCRARRVEGNSWS